MRITLLLGGSLRHEGGSGQQQFSLEVPQGLEVKDLLTLLDLPVDRVKMILVNGRGASLNTPIGEGSRVALFPPELSFNTFVSLSFRKESVEKRGN